MKKISLILLVFLSNIVWGIEIQTQDTFVIRIAVVDMNKAITELPLSKKAQEEIELFKQNKLNEIANLEKELEDTLKEEISLNMEINQIQHQISKLESELEITISTLSAVSQSTPTITTTDNKENKLAELKEEINKKQKNLENIRETIDNKKNKIKMEKEKIEKEIEQKKQRYEIEIYAELYKIIQQIAKNENINIVIEKSAILYGTPQVDITQKVIDLIKKQK